MTPDFKELENLNREHCGISFIKSYEVLNIIRLSPSKIKLIELVLSFQSNGQSFQMRYENIAQRIGGSPKSIATYVKDLKKMGYLITDHRKNKKMAGSKTYLKVDINFLLERIRSYFSETSTLTDETDAEVSKPGVIIESTLVNEKKDGNVPTDEYSFRIDDINPGKMMMRYSDDNQCYNQTIQDYDRHWVKNGQGKMGLEDLVEYLINYKEKSSSPSIRIYIEKILSGISSDYNDWQKKKDG